MAGQEKLRGLEPEKASAWLEENLEGARPPFDFELVTAGGSNLSYRVCDAAGGQWVLRRGPESARLATAHDMQREWRVMSALAAARCGIPVPACRAWCGDPEVLGSEFYVMDFVSGHILRTVKDAAEMTRAECLRASRSLLQVQAAMHTLDVEAVGLGDLSREHHGYVERQLHRWRKQVELSIERDVPLFEDLYQCLLRDNPGEQAPPALVHGDYRFDNTVLNARYELAAVLDWELCAIGDPVADFFWSFLYWATPEGEPDFLPQAPTYHSGFPAREWLLQEYAAGTGFDLHAAGYFLAFGRWKMACIIEGVYARIRKGAGGGMKTGDWAGIEAAVETQLQQAQKELERD